LVSRMLPKPQLNAIDAVVPVAATGVVGGIGGLALYWLPCPVQLS